MTGNNKNIWTPIRIALLYALIGGLWILFSDELVAFFFKNPAIITRISLYKGWGYVAVTAWLLYIAIKQFSASLRESREITLTAEKKFAITLSLLPEAIAIADKNGRYIEINDGFVKLMGYTKEEALGKTSVELNIWGNPGDRAEMVRMLNTDGIFRGFEIQARVKDSRMLTILLSGANFQMDKEPYMIFTAVDITRRKELETEAINKSSELLELNKELAKTNEDLEFFAHATYHDLREPLRQISLHIEFLHKKLELKDAEAVQSFTFVEEGAKKLDELLNDIRNYTGIRKNKYPSQAVDLNECAGKAVEMLQPEITKKHAVIKISSLPRAHGSAQLYMDVFKNLIDNAMKYNKQVPEISIYAESADICVADNGIGVAPEYRDKVFLMFERLHTVSEYSGTGVGLAICKKIVELYGGKISIKAGANGGSVVTFSVNVV